MPLIIILILLGMAPGLASTTDPVKEADALLSSPTLNLGQALYALDLYRQTLSQAHPPQAPLLIRLARTCFVVGELTVASQRRKYYEEGRNYAKMLIKEQPARVDGYYWLALNLCGLRCRLCACKLHPEGTPLALFTIYPDFSPHFFNQFF